MRSGRIFLLRQLIDARASPFMSISSGLAEVSAHINEEPRCVLAPGVIGQVASCLEQSDAARRENSGTCAAHFFEGEIWLKNPKLVFSMVG